MATVAVIPDRALRVEAALLPDINMALILFGLGCAMRAGGRIRQGFEGVRGVRLRVDPRQSQGPTGLRQ